MVLNGAVSGKKLGGQVVLTDTGVRTREGVLAVTKGANPDTRLVIDACVRVQNGTALRGGAGERIVREEWEVGELHQGSAHDRERDD